jgi:cold shock CspA family protein
MRGIILSYNRQRGWGFIGHEAGDVFFHVSGLKNRKYVEVNDLVEFELSKRNGRDIAINVVVIVPANANGGAR